MIFLINKNNYKMLLLGFCVGVICIVIYKLFIITNTEHFDFITKPELTTGDKITLQTRDGLYVTACSNCEPISNKCKNLLCMRSTLYNSGIFTVHKNEDNTWLFETAYGKFWERCENCIFNCDSVICADADGNPNGNPSGRSNRGSKFHLIKNGDGTIRLKSDNGKFLEPYTCEQMCYGKNVNERTGEGKVMTARGLSGNLDLIVTKIESVPKPKPVMVFKPVWQKNSVPRGVVLSSVT